MQTNIQESLEGAARLITLTSSLGQGEFAIRLLNALEILIETEFLEDATSQKQTNSVARRPIGQAILDAVSLELVGVGSSVDLVAGKLSGDQLADDVTVGEADDQAVLGRVVLVLSLRDQALASIVVGLSLVSFAVNLVSVSFD